MFKAHWEPASQEHVTWGQRIGKQVRHIRRGQPGGMGTYRLWKDLGFHSGGEERLGKFLSRKQQQQALTCILTGSLWIVLFFLFFLEYSAFLVLIFYFFIENLTLSSSCMILKSHISPSHNSKCTNTLYISLYYIAINSCDILHMLNKIKMSVSLQSQVLFMRNVNMWIYY